jgi:ubiquinone/menaquinone biosynthesis C-methylase UbiE
VALAPYFKEIVATDMSQQQIDHARPRMNIHYHVAPADNAPVADASVDLVTVAQALHWFDLPRFYAAVRRVTRPDGVIAVWCYQLH